MTLTTSDRHVWMDYTRGAAILLIILHHLGSVLDKTGMGSAPQMQPVDDFFTPFRMPILMFLSGMLLAKSLAKPVSHYVAGKLGAIAWPYIVWTVVILAVSAEISIQLLVQATYNSPTYLWYLWFLMVYYAAAWVIAKLHIPAWMVLGASLVLAYVAPDNLRLSRFFYLFIFFVAGDLVARNWDETLQMVRSIWGAILAGVLALSVAVLSLAGVEVRYETVYIGGVLAAVWLILRLMPSVRPRQGLGWLEFIGRHSIVFYVSHVVIERIVVDFLVRVTDSYLIIYPTTFAATVAVGFIVAFSAAKSSVVMLAFKLPLRGRRSAVRSVAQHGAR